MTNTRKLLSVPEIARRAGCTVGTARRRLGELPPFFVVITGELEVPVYEEPMVEFVKNCSYGQRLVAIEHKSPEAAQQDESKQAEAAFAIIRHRRAATTQPEVLA